MKRTPGEDSKPTVIGRMRTTRQNRLSTSCKSDMDLMTKIFIGIPDKEKPKDFPFNSLFDWVMSFLKGEWNDEKVLKQCEVSD